MSKALQAQLYTILKAQVSPQEKATLIEVISPPDLHDFKEAVRGVVNEVVVEKMYLLMYSDSKKPTYPIEKMIFGYPYWSFDPEIMSVLVQAIDSGYDSAITILANVSTAIHDPRGCHADTKPLMHLCIERGQMDYVRILIDHGADVKCGEIKQEIKRKAALFVAVEQPYNHDLMEMLLQHGADVNHKTVFGSPLRYATSRNNTQAVKWLLDHNADASEIDPNSYNQTILTAIPEKCDPEIIKMLLDNGAQMALYENFHPLHRAVMSHSPEAVAVLLEHKADPMIRDCYNNTPLHHAIKEVDFATIETLMKYGVTLNDQPTKTLPKSPLHIAVEYNLPTVVEWLLAHNADPVALDFNGRTPATTAIVEYKTYTPHYKQPAEQVQKLLADAIAKMQSSSAAAAVDVNIEEMPQEPFAQEEDCASLLALPIEFLAD